MMRIDFQKIEIHNFKSFGDEIFDFEKQHGLNLICGKNLDIPNKKNGAGKTSLIGALVFSLFGQTQSNSRNCNIANKWLEDKEVRVATYFSIGDNKYKVASGFNVRGGQYCELSEITCDGEKNLTKSTMSETRDYLENEILHCDKSIFMRTILLSSDQNYNFFMLKKAEKKDFIEKLFDITVFGDMYAKIHADLNKLDKDLVSRQNKLAMLNKNKDSYVEKYTAFENDKKLRLNVLQKQISTLTTTLNQLKAQHIQVNETEVNKYTEMREKLLSAQGLFYDKQRTLTNESQTMQLKKHKLLTLIESKQKAIDKYSDILNQLCEKCKPLFKEYYNINNFDEEINSLTTQCNDLDKDIKDYVDKIVAIQSKLDICDDKATKINAKIQELTLKAKQVDSQITKIQERLSFSEQDSINITKQKNPYLELKNTNELELQTEENNIKKVEENYRYLKFAENIVSQDTLRKFIISDLIGLLNNKIKTYLTKFGAKYEVVFDSDMNYKLIDENNEFDYGDFSGGERSQLMIAVCFAFRDFMYIRNNFSSNILFLDEFIDGAIDSAGMESVIQILTEYSTQYNQNVFIISHRKSEMDNTLFNNIIQIVKQNHISHIEYL